jgi:hypothetical protein
MVVVISQLQPGLGLKQFGQSVENLAIMVLGHLFEIKSSSQSGRRA